MRTSARYTGAAAVMAAVLLVSGCGSGGDEETAPGSSSATANEESGNGGSDAEAKPGSVQGIWNTTVDGEDFVLSVLADGATLMRADQACTGRVTDTGKPSLALKCPDGGGGERTNGTVESIGDGTMEVTWNGGDTDTFTKVADAPKDVPTDLGDLEDLVPQES